MSNQTDKTSLILKALHALRKTSFSDEYRIPNAFTEEVFSKHFLSLAEILTRTLRRGGGECPCSEGLKNFCINRRIDHDTFSIPEWQFMKLVNAYLVLASKIPLVVMELVTESFLFLCHTLFNTWHVFTICVSNTIVSPHIWKLQRRSLF